MSNKARLPALAAALFSAAAPTPAASADDCRYLLDNAASLVQQGAISEDLALLMLPYLAANVGCPWRTETKHEPFCRATTIPHPSEPVSTPPNSEWNGVDFREALLQIFLNNHNYSGCRDIFESDPLLQHDLLQVGVLQSDIRQKYNRLALNRIYFGIAQREPDRAAFSKTQEKMFTIFEQTPEWAYCSGNRYLDSSPPRRVYAAFDPRSKRVTMFNGACSPRDLYGLEVSFVPSLYAGLFIASHEFGHVIENVASNAWQGHARSEAKATYLGALMAECVSRLSASLFVTVKNYADALEKGERPVPGGASLTPTDIKFAQCATGYLLKTETYFKTVRAKINLETGEMPDDLGAVMQEFQPVD